ncbi:MAG: arginine--tRNA ligase, partial [Clostridia bacterium]|nr:arginine--tRNA ligase [Clostridia bacterium]
MINNELAFFVKKAFLQKGYDLNNTEIRVIESNLPSVCDYQCNSSFEIAKKERKNPFDIALEIAEILNDNKNLFSKAEAYKPGFINLTLSEEYLNKVINDMFNKEKFAFEKPAKKQLFVIDYGGPNIAKPLHVGHLRSPVIGESLKRIIQYEGHKVISDIHFGDFGLQIGMIIYGLKERELKPADITLEMLNEIYPQINSKAKTDKDLNNICAEITKELQDGNKEYNEYWKAIRKISAEDILKLYKYLDISFDLYEGESNAYEYINDLTKLLNEKNLIQISNGAKIIEIKLPNDSKEFPPLIYQKSNGAYLYGTTDMATVYERVQLFNPDHIIYIADLRQQLHFLQFFRAISKTGIIKLDMLEFHGFGTVNDISGQPLKTREGNTPK